MLVDLSKRDLEVLRELLLNCDPDVLNVNLAAEGLPEADLDELDALAERVQLELCSE